jgi:hypothetical protein
MTEDIGLLYRTCANISELGVGTVFGAWLIIVQQVKTQVHFTMRDVYAASDDSVHGNEAFGASTPHIFHRPSKTVSDQSENRFVIGPSTPMRTFWDILGAIFLAFDVIAIPASAFTSTGGTFWTLANWVTLVFWSFDMVASCLTGYLDAGVIVLKPRLIVLRYMKTWLLLDVIVVGPDWAFILLNAAGSSSDASQSGKFVRVLRTLRIARIVRVVKLQRFIQKIRDHIDSEKMFIAVNISKLVLFVLTVTHFLAAMWYAVGNLDADGVNWIDSHDIRDQTAGARYAISYHWSLTQFTPGSMDVIPYNVHERIYNIVVLILGLVLFSSFVSSITSSMTRLQDLASNDSMQLWLLRRYLKQNSVPRPLGWRILRYVEHAMTEQRGRVRASKIDILRLLTTPLQLELTYAVNFHCLKAHSLFGTLNILSHDTVIKLTSKALWEQSLADNDDVFVEKVHVTTMQLLLSGQLGYRHFIESKACPCEFTDVLKERDWVGEASLWTEWHTLGRLQAISECKMICIDAEPFAAVMHGDLSVWQLCSHYATKYVEWLCDTPFGKLTDVSIAKEMAPLVINFIGQNPTGSRFSTNTLIRGASNHLGHHHFSKNKASVMGTQSIEFMEAGASTSCLQ